MLHRYAKRSKREARAPDGIQRDAQYAFMAARVLALTLACFVQPHESARAQRSNIGFVTEIRRLDANPPCPPSRRIGNPQKPVLILRGRDSIPVRPPEANVPSRTAVLLSDQVIVHRSSDARLLIQTDYANGLLVLSPDFGRCGEGKGRDDYTAVLKGAAQQAVYQFETGVDSVSGKPKLILSLDYGAVTAQWADGLLYVHALDLPVRVKGTEFGVLVDSAVPRAYLYVKTGQVEFANIPNLVVTENQLFTWTRGGIPQMVSPLPPGFEREFVFHATEIWKPPKLSWWHRIPGPAKAVGGIGVVVAAFILRPDPDPTPAPVSRRRTIIVGLPL